MKHYLIAVLSAGIFASCSKQNSTGPGTPAPQEKKLVEIKNLTIPADSRVFSYDQQGRLVKKEASTQYWTYEYQPGKLIVASFNKATAALIGSVEYSLDQKGRTVSAAIKNNVGNTNYTQSTEYDANGYLVKLKEVYPNNTIDETFYTIINGNATHEEFRVNGAVSDVTDYFYDPLIKAKLYTSMGSSWEVPGLYGKGFTNEVVGFKRYNNMNILVFQRASSFVLNADGYVIKRTDNFPITNVSYDYEFTYQ